VQITAARHAIETDCGVGVAAVGNTCCDILVVVGDPANKTGIQCPAECWYDPVRYHVDCSISSLNSIPLIFPTNVRKLVFYGNSITSLEKDRFISSRLTELEEISVNGCEMETVKLRAFSGLRELALLSVCGNKLCEITQRTFEKMNRHAYLALVDSLIERLDVDLL